ncbi:unnamed protein product [Rotaria socialis]
MAASQGSESQINSNNLSNNENHNMNNIPLYAESKLTRQQAIHEIADIIVRSNMKPQSVECTFELLKKILPSDNTLPTTIDELFHAMMSSDNDWRLAQYFIRHKGYRSLLSATSNVSDGNSLSQEEEEEFNIIAQPLSTLLPLNDNHASSNSDDENILTPYERLQQCLEPSTRLARDFNLNFATEIQLNVNNDNMTSSSQQSQIASSIHADRFQRVLSESSSTISDRYRIMQDVLRAFNNNDDETSYDSMSNDNEKLCCFSGGKQCTKDIIDNGLFKKYHTASKTMDTVKSILTAITSSDHENNPSVPSNEQIRYRLCQIDELQNGQMKEFEIKTPVINTSVLLIKQDNKFHAYASKCCHYKVPLAKGVLINNRLRCFAHGACFRVDTGDIEDHPGHGNLPKYNVEIVDNHVILVARKQDLEKSERSKIPDEFEVEAKPVVAIIGAGAGGFTCADMLRQNGFRGRIVLFTREGTLPYDRVQLSKQPLKKPQDLLLRDHPYFKKAKIDLMLDTSVTNINWTLKNLTYQTLGKQMKSEQYDYLVLATGLRSRKLPANIPGGDLRNIFYLRTMEDANNLVNKVKSPETKNIVIIGDSFVALEMCGWLTTGLGGPDGKQEDADKKNVSVVMLLKAPLIRVFGEKIACAVQKVHEKNGAKFYSEATVTELTGEHSVVKFVQLATGESVPCDLVIVAIGSETCTELLQDSPIEMTPDDFIKVNDRLETSVDHVLAVGDITKYPLRIFNLDEVNCQHWQMACTTGHQAADTILRHYLGQIKGGCRSSKNDLYTTPFFWTTQNSQTTIRYTGYTRDAENVVIHGDLENEFKFVAYYIVDGYVRAVAQSKYDPIACEVAEVFYHKRNIRKEDIEHDVYGYRKYLDFKTKKPE